MKYGLLILSALLLAACNPKNIKNISTAEASAKYGHELGQKLSNRPGWAGNPHTSSGLWKFWDEFKIEDKIMTGYWEADCPVKTSNKAIKASIYKSNDEAIIALANWTALDQAVSVDVAWSKLGIEQTSTDVFIPEIKGFQSKQISAALNKITIPGKEGFIIVLKKRKK
jgi:hypothetical protein